MHINAKPLRIQRNPVHRRGKDKKAHGKTGQRVVAEMTIHSHATSSGCPTRNYLWCDVTVSPMKWLCHCWSWGGCGDFTAFPHIFLKHGGRAQNGQSHVPKSSPAYHTLSLHCCEDEKETAIILPPENMSLFFKLNYMLQIQNTKTQFTEMNSPSVNELSQQ